MITKNRLVSELRLRCLVSSEAEGHDYVIYPVPKWKQLGACHFNSQGPAGNWTGWELETQLMAMNSWVRANRGGVSWSWDLITTDSLDMNNVTSLRFKTVHMCFLACLPLSYKPCKALISAHWKCCIHAKYHDY